MRLFYLSALFFLAGKVYSQDPYDPIKIIPPSPTAASLGEYGNIDVSYYTGSPNISIPLYEIKTGGFSLPISLNYNASGIKVAQESSWVGLGWSLFAGGVITRTVRGKDDFDVGGYYLHTDLPECDENNKYVMTPNWNNGQQSDVYYFEEVLNGLTDGEPDAYYYNFGGFSGKFVMGKAANGGQIFFDQKNNLRVEFAITNIVPNGRWTITTGDGTKFFFQTEEMGETWFHSSGFSPPISYKGLPNSFQRSLREVASSWYLDLIVTPDGREIKFFYEEGGQILSVMNQTTTRFDRVTLTLPMCYPPLFNKYSFFGASREVIIEKHLKKIEFEDGYIIFNRSTREDVEPYNNHQYSTPQKLSEIVILNNSGELIKGYTFYHSYFRTKYSSGNLFSEQRLKLDSIVQYDENNIGLNPHIFEYNEPYNMPNKYTKLVDDWGFSLDESLTPIPPTLNGETNPTTISPYVVLPEQHSLTGDPYIYLDGAKKYQDETGAYIKRGTLESITYPTKGKTKFEFEPHTYVPYSPTDCFKLIPNPNWVFAFSDPFDNRYDYSVEFDLTERTPVTFTPRAYLINGEETLTNEFFGRLLNSENSTIMSFNRVNGTYGNGVITKVLSPGHYTLEVNDVDNYSISVQAQYELKVPVVHKTAGGLRIKTISNYDLDNKIIGTKKFIYTSNGLSTGPSSGRILNNLKNHYFIKVHEFIQDFDYDDLMPDPTPPLFGAWCRQSDDYLVRNTFQVFPIGFNSTGNIVGYDKVVVSDSYDGGVIEYLYNNSEPIAPLDQIPGVPLLYSSLNGRPSSILYKNSQGELIKTNKYLYEEKESSSLKGVKIFKPAATSSGLSFSLISMLVSDIFSVMYWIRYYDSPSEWWVLKSEQEETFYNGQKVSRSTEYNYDNFQHRQVTSQATTYSDGSTLSTIFRYPTDFNTQEPYTSMVNSYNVLTPVVEKVFKKDGLDLESIRTNYTNWGNGIIKPTNIQYKRGASSYVTKLSFTNYDFKGNLLSQSKENDYTISYVYGYSKNYPIVEGHNVNLQNLNQGVNAVLAEMGYVGGINDIDVFLNSIGELKTSTQKASWKLFNQKIRTHFGEDHVLLYCAAFKPLVGIISIVEAGGTVEYYDYDLFGRLKALLDDSSNLKKVYEYHLSQN